MEKTTKELIQENYENYKSVHLGKNSSEIGEIRKTKIISITKLFNSPSTSILANFLLLQGGHGKAQWFWSIELQI